MNKSNLELMVKMLGEVHAGTWKMTSKPSLIKDRKLQVKTKEFDLSNWISLEVDTNRSCGFTACAIGHAMVDARFDKLGFGSVNHRDTLRNFKPYFNGFDNWDAVEAFFEIDNRTAEYLFLDYNYPLHLREEHNVKHLIVQVMRRIQYLLAHGEEKFKDDISWNVTRNRLINPSLKIYQVRKKVSKAVKIR